MTDEMRRGANITRDGLYRYRLWRSWGTGQRVLFVMLNPSTADDLKDDPTIRKCIGFAQRWGMAGIEVVNLFALRATKPDDLVDSAQAGIDVVGPLNDEKIREAASECVMRIAAWGSFAWPAVALRAGVVAKMIGAARALRLSKAGNPWHPLYVPYSACPQPWPESVAAGSAAVTT